jgi:chitinase
LDFINLMAYDFHSSLEKTTGHNSPLYKRQGESGAAAEQNVVSGWWDEAGVFCPAGPG